MQKPYFLIATFLCSWFCFSQNYSVSSFQKINELAGNFMGDLDLSDNFGISIDAIGDLDGNGFNDLAVGAYTDDDGGTNRGAVWILFLDVNNEVISHTKISDTSGNFTGVLDGDDRFGGAVAYLGDLNNDGLIELAVGADYDGDGGFWHGAVWILSLNNDGTVNSHSKISDTQGGFTGFINGDAIFGTDIENIGDLNNDGIADLAVGSRRDADGGSRRGAVWILFMNADFTVNNYQKISDTQGNFTAPLQFEDYFGGSVASIGDLDQDGVNDIVVGAYRDDDQISNSGSFYVLFLNADGTVKSHQKVSNLAGALNSTISNSALFGESIDGVIDIDNDGKIEIVVGALRQENPTQMNQTGAIYLIELNTDGTVSEEYLYTYGENCFTGNLNSGDFFGGSVTILNNTAPYRFAVGAYKDSENGTDKGAVWILELGEISFLIAATQNPTDCATNDGQIMFADLNPNTSYRITYEFQSNIITTVISSDANGDLVLSGLTGGDYNNITVASTLGLCTDNLGDVTLNATGLNVNFTTQSPTICGDSDGSISLSNLAPNTTYQISYELNTNPETVTLTSNAIGELVLSNLFGGTYMVFTVLDINSNCEDILGDIFLDQPSLTLAFMANGTSSCNTSDGSILITGLAANQNYVVDYFYESMMIQNTYTADVNGEILLTGLSAGTYEFIMVVETVGPCTDGIGELIIENADFTLTSSFTNPTGCTVNDGMISLQGATANTAYTISYTVNGTPTTTTVNSDASGVIEINNLAAGMYESIVVEDTVTNCIANVATITLDSSDLTLTSSFINPTGCTVNDGIITLQGVTANTAYTVSYSLNGTPTTTTVNSDASGVIEINNLAAGMYESIVVEDTATNCIANVATITLDSSDLTLTSSFTNPTGCTVNDGIITLQGATANTAYTISYSLNGTPTTTTVNSDALGIIEINNLAAGMYESIVVEDTVTNCIANVATITLDSSDLILTSGFTNPTGCTVNDGIITLQGATANTAYTISYSLNGTPTTTTVNSDALGIIEINNLAAGMYESIVVEDTVTNCIANVATITLDSSDLTLTSSFTNPTGCTVNDGIITLQGATATNSYTISYTVNGTPTTLTVNSDALGVIEINNLAAGMYESIVVEDTVTNCIANVATITLDSSDLILTSSFTNPTGCRVNDGIITLQGGTANTAYTISYSLNGTPTTTTVNSDATGVIEVNNLAAGIYNNITIEENGSGCTFVFSFIELTCEVQTEVCFKIRKFFTPNNDGFNDTWQLEQEQNCDYSVYIYDRFGKIIIILTPNYPEWDGTYRGRKLPSSDYWISIHYTENGQQLKFSTNITLKR